MALQRLENMWESGKLTGYSDDGTMATADTIHQLMKYELYP